VSNNGKVRNIEMSELGMGVGKTRFMCEASSAWMLLQMLNLFYWCHSPS